MKRKSNSTKAVSLQQLQTQKRYTEEKSKGGPTTPQKQTKEKSKKPQSGFKKWLLKSLNFPEEKEADMSMRRKASRRRVVDLSEDDVRRQLIARARARATMVELEDDTEDEEKYVPRTSRYSRRRRSRYAAPPVRRRSRFATETKLVREHNRRYNEPDAEDSPPWVEDDYADRPYPGPKPEKNVREDSHVSAAARRRIRAAMHRVARREEERELERRASLRSRRPRPRRRLARRARRSSLRRD